MKKSLENKRQQEKEVITLMIQMYCHGQHHLPSAHDTLCPDCRNLTDYALLRTDNCPRIAQKTFCSNCPTHCYQPKYREQIKTVMRYAGPRMLFHHPILAIKHFVFSKIG